MRFLILFVVVVFAGCDSSPPPENGSQMDTEQPIIQQVPVLSETRPEVLVDARWLQQNLHDPRIRILELGQSYEEYLQAHIPHALYLDWLTDITDPDRPDQYMILSRQALEQLLGRLGITRDSIVVIYDTMTNRLSTRMFWTLRYYGHIQLRILDGGMQAWSRAGFAYTDALPGIAATDYVIDQINPDLAADRIYIEQRLRDDDFTLVDGRPADQFTGDAPGKVFHTGSEHARRGHIYGAKNIPWSLNFNEDGTFKPVEQLRDLYELRGIQSGQTIVTYCNEGLHAAPPWFVLSELLGYEDVRLYDASMSEWANLEDTRMSRGKFCM